MTKHLRLFMALLVVVLGCGPATPPSEPAIVLSQPDMQKVVPKARPIPEAEFTLTPEEYFRQLDDDKAGAIKKYRGRVIEITGHLERYVRKISGPVLLLIRVPDRLLFIDCDIPDPDPWDVAAPGQTVTVRGTIPDKFIIPTLTDCVIVKASGECRSRLTATELGRRCDADANAWKAELDCSGIVLSGVVEEVKEQGMDVWVVKLRTDTKYRVTAELWWPSTSDQHRLRAGNPIRVVGIPTVKTEAGEVRCWGAFLATTD